ncbi:MAG: hypoxanthine phosphoribosyltransferase [Alphaproteobacteria bacterium]|nr:MAG: hypoxanthine phosphoribosyltransferase [Alphaproteobacteria bacterium]TAF15415.1 MAG: hypoxanthine phosphoribosyltransferase [Alphaproteobacteria bacterium]TAF39363.1 MAG: hypoxanthine phosphoribosyltransferase [Alphaproteobacteria bacterium]TAF75673.1 MAG: hypoxanthine phosphoribosyltransferase [Alphaproteobacteria bacterium]
MGFIRPDDYRAPELITPLFTAEQIATTQSKLARSIRQELGQELLVMGLLKGSFVFIADLVRAMHHRGCTPQIDFMTLSSYGNDKESSGAVRMMSAHHDDLEGKPILLVDDILESGRTLSFAKQWLFDRGAASVHVCVLLDKPHKRVMPIEADYVGFTIEDQFVVGYGLDYAGYYRELPFIGAL